MQCGLLNDWRQDWRPNAFAPAYVNRMRRTRRQFQAICMGYTLESALPEYTIACEGKIASDNGAANEGAEASGGRERRRKFRWRVAREHHVWTEREFVMSPERHLLRRLETDTTHRQINKLTSHIKTLVETTSTDYGLRATRAHWRMEKADNSLTDSHYRWLRREWQWRAHICEQRKRAMTVTSARWGIF